VESGISTAQNHSDICQHFMLGNIIDGVIVNQLLVLLKTVEQGLIADMVNQTRNPGRNPMNVIQRLVRKEFPLITGIGKMTADVLLRFGAVKVRQNLAEWERRTQQPAQTEPQRPPEKRSIIEQLRQIQTEAKQKPRNTPKRSRDDWER